MAHNHQENEDFGAGADEDEKIWNPVIRQALIAGYIKKDVENYGLLKLTASGKKFMKKPESFMIVEDKEFSDEEYEAYERDSASSATVITVFIRKKRKKQKINC